MECLSQQQSTSSGSNIPDTRTAPLPVRKSQPELRQTTDVDVKPNTFDKLTEINTSRERHKASSTKNSTPSPSSIPRKIKLRMDTVDETSQGGGKSGKLDIMTRLGSKQIGKQSVGKQSVFTRLAN